MCQCGTYTELILLPLSTLCSVKQKSISSLQGELLLQKLVLAPVQALEKNQEKPRKKKKSLEELKWALLVLALTKAVQRFFVVAAALCPENLFGTTNVMWDEHRTQVRCENHFYQLLFSVKLLQTCKRFPFTDSWGGKGSIRLDPAAPKSCVRPSHQHLTQGTALFMCSTSFSDFSWCSQGLEHWMCLLCSLALLPKATINSQQRGLDLEKSWEKQKRGKMGCSE